MTMQWQVGDVRITSVTEQALHGIEKLIRGVTDASLDEIAWLRPHFRDETGALVGVIQSFVVETTALRLVVDTCVGNGKHRPSVEAWHRQTNPYLDAFAASGYQRSTIDVVLCTHMHVDHVGWNTYWDGVRWLPTFPNARYLFAEDEVLHWRRELARVPVKIDADTPLRERLIEEFRDIQRHTHTDSIEPIFEHGLAEIVPVDRRICAEVALVPTPGHTPGHVSIAIASRGQRALITGDSMHHPCQIARPHWGTKADSDMERGIATRREILASAEREHTLVLGSHFAPPTAGRILRDGDAYRLDCDPDHIPV